MYLQVALYVKDIFLAQTKVNMYTFLSMYWYFCDKATFRHDHWNVHCSITQLQVNNKYIEYEVYLVLIHNK